MGGAVHIFLILLLPVSPHELVELVSLVEKHCKPGVPGVQGHGKQHQDETRQNDHPTIANDTDDLFMKYAMHFTTSHSNLS